MGVYQPNRYMVNDNPWTNYHFTKFLNKIYLRFNL